jgi:cation diffusion facilitator CzcD-associated flavoprotein CzcO
MANEATEKVHVLIIGSGPAGILLPSMRQEPI